MRLRAALQRTTGKSLLILATCLLSLVVLLLVLPCVLVRMTSCTATRYSPDKSFTEAQKQDFAFWLGNADDPLPPPDYLIDDPRRVDKWYWRNPLHNFTFYVIGVADKPFERFGICPSHTFNPAGGWNWCVTRYGSVELPFISYEQGKFQTYFGWRDRGNFGIKLNL